MTPEEYEAKRRARYERLLAAAERAQKESEASWNQAHDMASAIPFGQPILVGHHSEGRDRRYRAKIEAKHRKGYELHQKAAELRGRAEAARSNNTIFSDDPAAQEKLADKIERLQQRQEMMRKANVLVRKGDTEGLLNMGFSQTQVDYLMEPSWNGRRGFESFELTNNNANINRLKRRLKELELKAEDETTETVYGDIRIVDNVEENRLQIFFPGKPDELVRSELKHSGFRWSPTNGCWQAYRGPNANYYAKKIVEEK